MWKTLLQFCDVKHEWSHLCADMYLVFTLPMNTDRLVLPTFALFPEDGVEKLTRWCCTSISKFDRQIYLQCAKVSCFAIGLEESVLLSTTGKERAGGGGTTMTWVLRSCRSLHSNDIQFDTELKIGVSVVTMPVVLKSLSTLKFTRKSHRIVFSVQFFIKCNYCNVILPVSIQD